MNVKSALKRDLKKIFKLELQVFQKDGFSKDVIKELLKISTFFFKIEKGYLNKELIGFIIVLKDRADRANIINFLIAPKYQSNGFGSFLLNYTIKRIKKMTEIKKIVLNVKTNNMTAIDLYKKYNFKIIQEIKNYYHSKENSYLMELNV